MPGTLHDGVSADTRMDTSYQKSLVVCKDQRAMGDGDRMTGGISLVSKFKVTNLVLIEDEEVCIVHVNLPIDLSKQNCADSPCSFGIDTSAPVPTCHYSPGMGYSGSEFTKWCLGRKKKPVFCQ